MWYTGVYMLVFDREGYGPPLMLLQGQQLTQHMEATPASAIRRA